MASVEQIRKTAALIGEIDTPRIIDDAHISSLLDMFIPTFSTASEVRTAIEICQQLSTHHADQNPQQSNYFKMRAEYLAKNWTALPVVETVDILGYVLTSLSQITTGQDWEQGATSVTGDEFDIPAFSGDDRYVLFATQSVPTRIAAEVFTNNLIGAFTTQEAQLSINGINYYITHSNQQWEGANVSGTKWFIS